MKSRHIKQNSFLIACLAIVLSFSSCTKDEEVGRDVTKPVGEILKPADGDEILRGASIIFEGVFSDDVELKKCELTISKQKALKGWDIPWTPEKDIVHLSGKEDAIRAYQAFSQEVPVDIMSGEYVLDVKLIDEAGNFMQYSVDVNIK